MPRILHLVLYSDDKYYTQMYHILNEYYKTFPPDIITTVFYRYKENVKDYFDAKSNILYLNGTDDPANYASGIIEKTLKAFRHFEKDLQEYDYVLRSNISTIVDINLLIKQLQETPITFYGGGHKDILNWLGGGITDSVWFGTEFIQGTSIILTAAAVQFILDNEYLVRKDIVDDVSIGIFMREYKPDVKVQDLWWRYMNVPAFSQNNQINTNGIYNMISGKYIFYRNKCFGICSHDRSLDVIQMQLITDILLSQNK